MSGPRELNPEEAAVVAQLLLRELNRLQSLLHEQVQGLQPGDDQWGDTADQVESLWGVFLKVDRMAR